MDSYRGDGLNLYAYVANNPVNFIDPTGYCGEDTKKKSFWDKTGDTIRSIPDVTGEFLDGAWTGFKRTPEAVYNYIDKFFNNPLRTLDETNSTMSLLAKEYLFTPGDLVYDVISETGETVIFGSAKDRGEIAGEIIFDVLLTKGVTKGSQAISKVKGKWIIKVDDASDIVNKIDDVSDVTNKVDDVAQGTPNLTRDITSTSELNPNLLDDLTFEGTIQTGGRSGGQRPLTGTPNSYVKTSGGHTLVYDGKGDLIYDISSQRVKMSVFDQAPNGNFYRRDLKLTGDVPVELLK